MSNGAYVLDAVRTPIGRYGKGLAEVRPDDLAAHVVRAVVDRTSGLDPARVEDIAFGDANGAGEDNRNVARMAALLAEQLEAQEARRAVNRAVPGGEPLLQLRAGTLGDLDRVNLHHCHVPRLRVRTGDSDRGSGPGPVTAGASCPRPSRLRSRMPGSFPPPVRWRRGRTCRCRRTGVRP